MQYRGFELDRFQTEAIEHLEEGRSVLVSAPTGTGKTLIADWIVDQALALGKEVIYTAPIKALSNQKFRDYVRKFGEDKVGLVTGDLVIRRDAPCRVMTTEILRNMLLTGEQISNLHAVVVDEIHFLDDWDRGTVWEEVLIYLPSTVQIVGLSATLANLEEFADWLSMVRGATVGVVTEFERAVPLTFQLASTDTGLVDPKRYDELFKKKARQGMLTAAPNRRDQRRGRHNSRDRSNKRDRRGARTSHTDVFVLLEERDLLPYLYFVFSRRDTERFARALSRRLGRSLLDSDERRRVSDLLKATDEAAGTPVTEDNRQLYLRGVAFHHAGLHVHLKALVEQLYEEKLVRVLYCTSTFALGINMPARTAVFDGIMKYNGRAVAPLSTRQFMQKAGRAGRRGLDEVGHVVIRVDLSDYKALKPFLETYQRGAYEEVNSRFNLSWNSIVNLVGRHDEDQIRAIVEKSFRNYRLVAAAEEQISEAQRLEADEGNKSRKLARRLRRRANEAGDVCWHEFTLKRQFLQHLGYLAEDLTFNAGARVLQHLQIAEIFVTELVLSGAFEDLDVAEWFGVMAALTNDLPRGASVRGRPTKAERALLGRVDDVRWSYPVEESAAISRVEVTWCPEMFPLGRAWAEGKSLVEILETVDSTTDFSGDLITGFRRAKDLGGQLRQVYAELPDRLAVLEELLRTVSRDEVEVLD